MKPAARRPAPVPARTLHRYMLLLAALLLPVYGIALYSRPSADDFGYSLLTHAAVVQQQGLSEVLRIAWQENLRYYHVWNGTYLSSFLATLQPGIWGSRRYWLTVLFVTVPLYLCLYGALRLVLGRLWPQGKALAPAAALLLLFALVEGMPNPVQALYWYDGAAFYQPFFALAVLNAGLAAALALGQDLPRRQQAALLAAACVCSLVIPGGHPVVGLLNAMLQCIAAMLALLCKGADGRRRFCLLAPALLSAAGLLLNVTAPGVRVRASGFSSASLPEAVVKSFVLAALALVRWLDVPLLCLLALTAPLLWGAVCAAPALALFRRPWLAPAVTFTLLWGMLCLPSYTMGGIGPGRLINVVWMTFLLGSVVSLAALLGWLRHCRGADFAALRGWLAGQGKRLHVAAVAALLCIACIGGHTVKEGLDNAFATSLEAAWELGRGIPQRYAAALDAREAVLTDPAADTVTIHCLTEEERPYLLFFSDVFPGADHWGLAKYYGKQQVFIE